MLHLFLLQNNRSRMENTIGIVITTVAGSKHTILLFTHTQLRFFNCQQHLSCVFFSVMNSTHVEIWANQQCCNARGHK